jgi:hypothetical protein
VTEARKLLELDPDKARANLEMGYALGNLCDFYLRDNFDVKKAIDFCRRSIGFEQAALRIAPERTEISIALANRFGWLADALLVDKAHGEARKARLSEQSIIDALVAKDPRNFELRFRQTWPSFGLATIEMDWGNPRLAVSETTRIVGTLRSLLTEEPNNVEVRRALARSHYARAKALAEFDPAKARAELNETRKIIVEIERADPQGQALSGFWKAISELERKLESR